MSEQRTGDHAGYPPVLGLPGLDRARVMGILNVTPDSFSDGGAWSGPDDAVRHGLAMLAAGADIVDVGGESTRPGARRVDEAEELRRVEPVVRALAAAGAVISIDTMRSRVAAAALEAGARIVNDVSGGLADPDLPRVVADARVPYVVMHWRGHSRAMQQRAVYADVVGEVCGELTERLDAVVHAGVDPYQVVLDPGLGFAKAAEHNWRLLNALPRLRAIGRPVLVGASRKMFLRRLLGASPEDPCPATDCDDATAAVTAIAARDGAWCVRVHDVRPNLDAVHVAAALQRAVEHAGSGLPGAGP